MAGLLCALSHGEPFFEAARFGSLIGSLNVGKKGATGGIPTYEEAIKIFGQLALKETIDVLHHSK